MDPELDEPVTDMGFVEAVSVTGRAAGAVQVSFRLPTYWCSPNFAFLMADDIKRAGRGSALGRARPWSRCRTTWPPRR